MQLDELILMLEGIHDVPLKMILNSKNKRIPDHFHITEVAKIEKTFIDCGGVMHKKNSCVLQVWVADDIDHVLMSKKLLNILKLAKKELFIDTSWNVEVEYGSEASSNYKVSELKFVDSCLGFYLDGKQTECLAPDKCGVKNKCCKKGGCC